MKFKRKLQLFIYSLVTILTFRKFYVCEECHHIHRFTGKEFDTCGGWFEPYVYVSNACADACIQKACNCLRESIFGK